LLGVPLVAGVFELGLGLEPPLGLLVAMGGKTMFSGKTISI
jgi:hypothetical protein